mgnify:CR=1 FL=1
MVKEYSQLDLDNFDKIKISKFTEPKRMNYTIGIITALISLSTLINIINAS